MASLYLGTGGLEQALAQEVSTALERKKELRCQLLLDHLRGTRGSPNSCSILQPIIRRYHPRASLSLYHTPNFRGLQKKLFPERFNEGMGLQHMKFFVIDNNVIITGYAYVLCWRYYTGQYHNYSSISIWLYSCSAVPISVTRTSPIDRTGVLSFRRAQSWLTSFQLS